MPILLASYLLPANIPQGARLYGIVVVVVVFSVLVQGSLVPTVARALRLPMRTVQPEPWALGIRLRTEPEGFHRFTISPGSPADGRTVEELADLPVDVWVSFVVRDHQLLTVRGDTTLRAGDDVLVLADDDVRESSPRSSSRSRPPHHPPTPGSSLQQRPFSTSFDWQGHGAPVARLGPVGHGRVRIVLPFRPEITRQHDHIRGVPPVHRR